MVMGWKLYDLFISVKSYDNSNLTICGQERKQSLRNVWRNAWHHDAVCENNDVDQT